MQALESSCGARKAAAWWMFLILSGRRRPVALVYAGLLALGGCGGGGGQQPIMPPTATAKANAMSGTAPLTVQLDASGSTDPQNLALSYTWAFADGSANATGPTVNHTFNNHGNYTVTVTVSNGTASSGQTVQIAVAPAAPAVQVLSIPVNVLGIAATIASAQLVATDRENLALTYSISGPPSVGSATINAGTGAITYTLPGLVAVASDSFTVKVANLGASTQSTVSVALNSDPLLGNQWHLQNTGQDAFASVLPVAGNDMNLSGAWAAGFSGRGICVQSHDATTGLHYR